MAYLLPPASKTMMLLAKCVPSLKKGAAKFKVKRLELDINLNMVGNFNFGILITSLTKCF